MPAILLQLQLGKIIVALAVVVVVVVIVLLRETKRELKHWASKFKLAAVEYAPASFKHLHLLLQLASQRCRWTLARLMLILMPLMER